MYYDVAIKSASFCHSIARTLRGKNKFWPTWPDQRKICQNMKFFLDHRYPRGVFWRDIKNFYIPQLRLRKFTGLLLNRHPAAPCTCKYSIPPAAGPVFHQCPQSSRRSRCRWCACRRTWTIPWRTSWLSRSFRRRPPLKPKSIMQTASEPLIHEKNIFLLSSVINCSLDPNSKLLYPAGNSKLSRKYFVIDTSP